jgi:hypothetical protein
VSLCVNKCYVVFNRLEAFARFRQANGLDCRINAYPNYVEWKGMNRQEPNFIFIDLDYRDINLAQLLSRISVEFNDYNLQPTILSSGNGYHIYLPVTAFILELGLGIPFTKVFTWAERHLSDNLAHPCHIQGLSFKNCMLRVPGSSNSKVSKEVKIIQRWNGIRPSIKPLLEEFYIDITEDRINEIQGIRSNTYYTDKIVKYWRSWRSIG